MEQPKILLLFGAGASHGSGGTNKPVPLGHELFSALCNAFPNTWGAKIKGELKNQFNQGFEIGMDSFYNTPQDLRSDVAPLLVELSIFFSKFCIKSSDNLYLKMTQRYKNDFLNRRIITATLNYDCLIEYAFLNSGIRTISYFGDDLGAVLLKLHGSCNFIPQNIFMQSPNLTLNLDTATINTDIKAVHPTTVAEELANISLPAAMSLYTHEKRNMISPRQIKMIQKEYEKIANQVDLIIIIGVRPNPHIDLHIWDALGSTNAKVILFGNKEDSDNWANQKRADKNTESFAGYFQESYKNMCSKIDEVLTI